MQSFYVYILQTQNEPHHHYAGFTEDLTQRLEAHNTGSSPHTTRYRPWHIKAAIASTDREQAQAFERYLTPPLGRAFAKKRL